MFEIVFDPSIGAPGEKRITAANNLVALAKELAGQYTTVKFFKFDKL